MKEFNAYLARLKGLGINRSEDALVTDLGEKKLFHFRGEVLTATYPVSYSKKPRSCKTGSFGTPWGLHEVAEKHGDGASPGMVFVGREATGQCWQELMPSTPAPGSLVTTRILRLRGLEPGLNQGPGNDSFDRFIYIHGTNFPERFPENLSAGCLLMRDADLIELYARLGIGSHVWLSEPLFR